MIEQQLVNLAGLGHSTGRAQQPDDRVEHPAGVRITKSVIVRPLVPGLADLLRERQFGLRQRVTERPACAPQLPAAAAADRNAPSWPARPSRRARRLITCSQSRPDGRAAAIVLSTNGSRALP